MIGDKKCNIALNEKLQKYQHYHLEILIKKKKKEEFDRYLKKLELRIGNASGKQRKILFNINKLFNGRNDTIKFVNDLRLNDSCSKKQLKVKNLNYQKNKTKRNTKNLH